MKRSTAFVTMCLLLIFSLPLMTGCFGDDGDTVADPEILNALPDWEALKLTLPEGGGSTRARLIDEAPLATLYDLTRDITTDLNGFTFLLLSIVDEIVRVPATETDGGRSVWAPEEPLSGLDPGVPRFTLTEVSENRFDYLFEYRPKDGDENSYLEIWSGTMTRDPDSARRGTGEMTINYDNIKAIDAAADEEGLMIIDYDIREGEDRVILMDFQGFHADDMPEGETVDAQYSYRDNTDNSGEFIFEAFADLGLDGVPDGVKEKMSVITQWEPDGVGQATAIITQGSLEENGLISAENRECWNSSFRRSYNTLLITWDEDFYPEWAAAGVDNPTELEEDLYGSPEECPYGFDVE